MTRSRLGKSKRLAAFLCALLLTLETVAFPLTQAKAAATAALATVGFGVTTAAFLAACGIYPYWASADASETFSWGDWETEDLAVLLQEYNAANAASPIASQQIRAFLQGATLVVGSTVWEKLCAFAEWIKTKYNVTDNQTGVELGAFSGTLLPVVPVSATVNEVLAVGHLMYLAGTPKSYAVSSVSDTYIFAVRSSGTAGRVCTASLNPGRVGLAQTTSASVAWHAYSSVSVDGLVYYRCDLSTMSDVSTFNGSAYSSFDDGVRAVFGSFQGVTADTSTVSIPAALPQGTEYGGLRVSGLPAATTAESVTDAVQDSVGERLKTPVEVVEVELAPGTEVDSETGAITQNPVVIEAPVAETIPAVSELIAPDSFVGTAVNALQTKFPFCLPFDVMRIAQAFIVPPSAPVITLTFHEPFTDADYTISVDLSPWDNVAAVVRFLWSLVLFVGFSLRIASLFHVDRSTGELFLGNVGSPGV